MWLGIRKGCPYVVCHNSPCPPLTLRVGTLFALLPQREGLYFTSNLKKGRK
jgi:hypothetical protein